MNNNINNNLANCLKKIESKKGMNFYVQNFYRILSEEHPDMQAAFASDLKALKIKFQLTFDSFINWFESIETLENELINPGKHHKKLA